MVPLQPPNFTDLRLTLFVGTRNHRSKNIKQKDHAVMTQLIILGPHQRRLSRTNQFDFHYGQFIFHQPNGSHKSIRHAPASLMGLTSFISPFISRLSSSVLTSFNSSPQINSPLTTLWTWTNPPYC